MITEKNTGGYAFPGLNAEFTGISSEGQERYEIQPSGGMTLRDYFAAKVMQGMMANGFMPKIPGSPMENNFHYAEASYAMADAMLKARSAK